DGVRRGDAVGSAGIEEAGLHLDDAYGRGDWQRGVEREVAGGREEERDHRTEDRADRERARTGDRGRGGGGGEEEEAERGRGAAGDGDGDVLTGGGAAGAGERGRETACAGAARTVREPLAAAEVERGDEAVDVAGERRIERAGREREVRGAGVPDACHSSAGACGNTVRAVHVPLEATEVGCVGD